MTATAISRDEAKEQARARLPEVLAEVIPGFHSGKAFRCLNPDHEDRHPSMRYLSRTNTVRCFSCGWSGDVFDVVGAVFGLTGGDAFVKAYDMLGLDPKGGRHSRPRKPAAKPKATPGTWAEIVGLIFPPGWDAPEPEIRLPMPMTVIADAETGLAGRLAVEPIAVFSCLKCGLRGWHFDDVELGEFFEDVRTADFMVTTTPEFLDWLRMRAAPAHMVKRLARFIVREGQRRRLEAAFAAAYSSLQNHEAPDMVLEDVLNQAELATGDRFDMPDQDGAAMRETVDDLFQRFHNGEDTLAIVGAFRSTMDVRAAI
jgi:hypothetical protein